MIRKTALATASFLLLIMFASVAQAATITSCRLDRELYKQGEVGYVSVTVYNDEDNTIRVYEITASVNYFYVDDSAYLQSFFTNATLPVEILQGQSSTFYIPLSLPTNIASGYTKLLVRAKTEIWSTPSQRWYQSDNPTSEPVMYIESPYKQQFEDQQAMNQDLQEQLQGLQTSYNNTSLVMYIFIAVALALGASLAFLSRLLAKPKAQPAPA